VAAETRLAGGSKAITSEVFRVLKDTQNKMYQKILIAYQYDIISDYHGNVHYVQKQPRLLDFV